MKNKLVFRKLLRLYKRTNDVPVWKEESFTELSHAVADILDASLFTKSAIEKSADFDELTNALIKHVNSQTEDLPKSFALAAAQCLMKNETADSHDSLEIYAAWITHLKNKGSF